MKQLSREDYKILDSDPFTKEMGIEFTDKIIKTMKPVLPGQAGETFQLLYESYCGQFSPRVAVEKWLKQMTDFF